MVSDAAAAVFPAQISTTAQLQPKATVVTKGFAVSRGDVADAKNDVLAWLKELGDVRGVSVMAIELHANRRYQYTRCSGDSKKRGSDELQRSDIVIKQNMMIM
jgi:hypothetical protein